MNIYPRPWAVALLGVALACGASSQAHGEARPTPSPEDVGRFIQSGLDDLDIPGAAAAVIEDGEITLVRGFGRRDRAGNLVSAQTPFQIASVSKSFTALIILQLAAEGRLAIDDPVVDHVLSFRMADPAHTRAVTLRHLMNHTSGFATVDGNRLRGIGGDDPQASEYAVRALGDSRPRAAPGAEFCYSNANYIVLGHVIETIEQKPYEEVLEARILSRIGMANTYAYRPWKQVAPAAKGHAQWFGFAKEDHHRPGRATIAAGGIMASAEDLAKYLRALSERDARIVPPTLSRTWDDASFTGYAFGWHHTTIDGRRAIFHDGLRPGFRAQVMILPDERRAALLLMNVSGILDGNLHIGAVHHALGLPPVAIQPSTAITATLWGSLVMTMCFALGLVLAFRKAFKLRHTPWNYPEVLRWALIVVPTVAFAGGAYALLVFVPQSLGLDFTGTGDFYPDLAALLLATATIAVGWAITLPFMFVKRPRRIRSGDSGG